MSLKMSITLSLLVIAISSGVAVASASAAPGWIVGGNELGSGESQTFTEEAKVTKAFVFKVPLLRVEVECKTLQAKGAKIIGAAVGVAGKDEAEFLRFGTCVVLGELAATCEVEGKELKTNALKSELEEMEGVVKDKISPKTGELLGTLKLINKGSETCRRPYFEGGITGSITANLSEAGTERITHNLEFTKTSGSVLSFDESEFEAEFTGSAEAELVEGKKWLAAPPPPRVEQVNFSKNLAVKIDHTKNVFPEKALAIGEYEGKVGEGKDEIEWKSPKIGEVAKNWPIAYVLGTKIKLEVKLALEAATQTFLEKNIEGEPVLTGEATYGGTTLKFEKKFSAAAIKANRGFLVTGEIESSNALPAKVLYALTSISWKWEYKEKGAVATKIKLGNTTHNLYSTFATPVTGEEIYLTVLDFDTLGIEKETSLSKTTAIAGVWKGFSHLEGTPGVPSVHVRTYNPATSTGELDRENRVLEYYGEIVKPKLSLREVYEEEIIKGKRILMCPAFAAVLMLESAVGRCGAWASLFVNALGIEGVVSELINIFVKFGAAKAPCSTIYVCVMLIKNWSFGTPGFGEFPYEINQVKDEEGVPAQGVKNPPPFFWDHAIVKAGVEGSEALYDPSYGAGPFLGTEVVKPATEKSVLEEYQKKSIDGYCRSTTAEQELVEKGEKEAAAPIECQKVPAALELAPEKTFKFP